jgi:hypothetical protein
VEPDNVSRLDRQRHQHFGAFQFCSLEIAVRLLVRRRRGIGIFQFEHVREDHLHRRPPRNSTARRTPSNRRRATRVDSSVGDLGLLESIGVHQAAVAGIGGEKLQRLLFKSYLLQLQLGTEAVIARRAGPEVLAAGMGYAAHLALAWVIFRAHQAVSLPLRGSHCWV